MTPGLDDWMLPPSAPSWEAEHRFNIPPQRPPERSEADAYRMGGLAGMDRYAAAKPPSWSQRGDPRDVWKALDVASAERDVAPNQYMPPHLMTGQETPRVAAAHGALPDEAIDALRWHNVPEAAIGVLAGRTAARYIPNPLVRSVAMAPAIMGALADTAEAAKLYVPRGRILERQAAGFSTIKGGTPIEQMHWTLEHGAPVPTRTAMPIDKALRVGDEVIPIVGDPTRKLGEGGYLGGVGSHTFTDPVKQEGGFDFALGQKVDPRTGLQDVWGNNPGAATQIDDLARASIDAGRRPVVVSTMMGKTGGDFHNQTYETVRQMTDPSLFSAELKASIDRNMINNRFSKADAVKGWPGIGSENLDEFIKERGGNVRSKLMKVLDQARVIKEGGPDVGMARVANTNPDLYGTPSGYMGYHIADVAPGSGVAEHSTFPVSTRGSNVRGLGGSVPGELVMRDLAAGLAKMHKITGSPQYLNRMDYYSIRPPNEAAIDLGMKPLPKTQIVDQRMIDSIGEYVRKHGLKAIPPAALMSYGGGGIMGGTAASDRYNAQ